MSRYLSLARSALEDHPAEVEREQQAPSSRNTPRVRYEVTKKEKDEESPPPAFAPLDDEVILLHFASKHSPTDVDQRIDRLSTRASNQDATPLDIVLLDDWRRIRTMQHQD